MDNPTSTSAADEAAVEPDAVVEADTLVEEVSIDGMCGVY
ncbi:mycofactocin precursor MftA [Sinomonas flava]|uniref:Mycofactocin n=1 Tax=Sinomonas flava TaxID=496857 RepID=A0ABN3BRW5_9MICC